MNDDDLIRRLARACAHGTRQMGLVNELLAEGATRGIRTVGRDRFAVYGALEVGSKSFRHLRSRLHSVGFIVVVKDETITMRFPEQDGSLA